VAVVPGYVRCPKCQTALPQVRRLAGDAGGTALETGGGFPVVPVVVGVAVIGGLIALFAMRGGDDKRAATPAPAPAQVAQPAQAPAVAPPPPPAIAAPVTPTGPTPSDATRLVERELTKQRLWGTVEVDDTRIDIRSGGCSDPAMGPLLDAQTPTLQGAGLTKLRCLAQSGRVVFERDL
jgi:hypothetical protein